MSAPREPSHLARTGAALGFLALVVGLLHFFVGPIEPAPTIEQVVHEKITSVRDAVVSGLKGEALAPADEPARRGADDYLRIGVVIAGAVALALGLLAAALGQERQLAGMAATLGASAMLVQFAILLVGALVLALIIGALIVNLDLDL